MSIYTVSHAAWELALYAVSRFLFNNVFAQNVTNLFCLALQTAFSCPGAETSADPCTIVYRSSIYIYQNCNI